MTQRRTAVDDRQGHDGKAPSAQKRRTGTDDEIVRVATRLFRERGYHGTSMSDVAGVIGVTAASLYYHFESKQELLLSVLRAGMDTLLESLEEIAAADAAPEERLERAISNHLAFVLQRGDAVAVFLRERRFLDPPRLQIYELRVDRYDELFTSIVAEACTEGGLPDLEPKLLSMLILGTINSVVEWYRPDGRYSQEELSLSVQRLIAAMLSERSANGS